MLIGGVFNKVQTGIYAGFSRAEMQAEFARFKAALQQSGSRLTGAGVNGQSFQFGSRADMSLEQWGRSVRAALAQVDPDYLAPSSTIETRFA